MRDPWDTPSSSFTDNTQSSLSDSYKTESTRDRKYSLGVVVTPSGESEIPVMNDLFINYTFDNQRNNIILKNIVNIFLEDYIKSISPRLTNIAPIRGDIFVETQYEKQLS